MKDYIVQRAKEEANYIINHTATIRNAAKKFGVSRSTVHKDMQDRLPKINQELYKLIINNFDFNIEERHLRGGEATRRKYLKG